MGKLKYVQNSPRGKNNRHKGTIIIDATGSRNPDQEVPVLIEAVSNEDN